MKILENFIQSKTTNPLDCEDGVFINDDFVCVIDGATSQSERLWYGVSSGKFATNKILETLDGISNRTTKNELVDKLSKSIYNEYIMHGLEKHVQKFPHERISASLVIFSKFFSQIWFIGDCQCMINNLLIQNPNPINQIVAEARSFFLQSELSTGKSVEQLLERDTGREFITPLLIRQRLFQNIKNSPYSHGVIDGFEIDTSFIKTIEVPDDTKYLVLASDGYPFLKSTLALSEIALDEVLKDDPLCMELYKSTKGKKANNWSFDDRAYIRFEL